MTSIFFKRKKSNESLHLLHGGCFLKKRVKQDFPLSDYYTYYKKSFFVSRKSKLPDMLKR